MISKSRTHLLQTLLMNWRDIAGFLIAWVGVSIASDVVTTLSAHHHNPPGLANLINGLQGFANFAGASLCTYLLGIAVAWPTLNRWGLHSWSAAWETLSLKERFYSFMAVAIGTLIAAALCFNVR